MDQEAEVTPKKIYSSEEISIAIRETACKTWELMYSKMKETNLHSDQEWQFMARVTNVFVARLYNPIILVSKEVEDKHG